MYGVVDVFQADSIELAPGETSRLDYVVMVDLTLTEFEIGFRAAQTDDDEE
jgi:hypothetical protein